MLLMRICPGIPYILLNFMLGITQISLQDFIIGGLGMFPGMLTRLFIGTTISELTKDSFSFKALVFDSENTSLYIILAIFGLFIFIAVFTYISRVTKRYIQELELQLELS